MPGTVLAIVAILAAAGIGYARYGASTSAFGMPIGKIDDVFGVGTRTWRRHTERRR